MRMRAYLIGWGRKMRIWTGVGCFGIETVFAKVDLSRRTFRNMERVHIFDFADREDTAATTMAGCRLEY